MSKLSDFLRRRAIPPEHHTRRALARYVHKRGFEIGDYTYGVPAIRPWGSARLTVGRYTSIAAEVEIFLGGDHRMDAVSLYPFDGPDETGAADVWIGSDVWIGFGATILPGVRIGHGAVVGARAVVSRDVPDYGIAVGNPARVVRHRFAPEIIAALLRTAWWDLDRAAVLSLKPLLTGTDVPALVAACERLRATASAQ
ncbi:CatB-related O-acetyltransferase [Rhodoplanes serenus]|uniref:CatB-related O-acetyltransferase n=1 Tax=Rhodoplanes serenus TaxID=200615 RepID=UPI001FDF6C2B|nr:CatB-related O-acetyltransferase [Rhodoplanes serenus]